MMVGVNISDDQLGSIADRTIQEADTNGDNSISFNEFVKAGFPASPIKMNQKEILLDNQICNVFLGIL